MQQAERAVEIRNVSVVLGKQAAVLTRVSAQLSKGKIIGLLGPSGAGKTTLLRAIVGRQHLSNGTIRVLGKPAADTSLRREVSYMTQGLSVYGDLTVTENIRYFARMLGLKKADIGAAVTGVIRTLSLQKQADSVVHSLSGGQKQRVSLAVSLLGKPKLLVLDEPTVGLDPVLREQLWQLFRSLVDDGATILISSHVMDEASRCDELLLLRDGRLLVHATPRALCEKTGAETVEAAFVHLVEGAAR